MKWCGWMKEKGLISWRGIIEALEGRRRQRKWKASTTRTAFGTIRGVIARRDMYTLKFKPGDEDYARDYARLLRMQEIDELGDIKQAEPLTTGVVRRIIRRALRYNDTQLAAYVALMWATAARPGCTQALQTENVSMKDNGDVRVRFVKGKAVRLRQQPYTIHSRIVPEARIAVRRWCRQKEKFPEGIMKKALAHTRAYGQGFQLRSFRRGAAMTLARAGASIQTIMKFTGHASEAMCYRYLGWGWSMEPEKEVRQAANCLAGNDE
jgi:integrase